MKPCGKCKERKPLEEFYRSKRLGRQHWCKECSRAYNAALDPEKKRTYARNWYQKNRYTESQKQRARKYGLSIEQFYVLLEDQGFCCAACGDELNFVNPNHTHIDHCHDSGRVRGVLCKACNNALGFCNDDPTRVDRLAAYAHRTCV